MQLWYPPCARPHRTKGRSPPTLRGGAHVLARMNLLACLQLCGEREREQGRERIEGREGRGRREGGRGRGRGGRMKGRARERERNDSEIWNMNFMTFLQILPPLCSWPRSCQWDNGESHQMMMKGNTIITHNGRGRREGGRGRGRGGRMKGRGRETERNDSEIWNMNFMTFLQILPPLCSWPRSCQWDDGESHQMMMKGNTIITQQRD